MRAIRLRARLSGSRFARGVIVPGGVRHAGALRLDGVSLAELTALPLGDLALPPDPALDAAIARDALAAMCLDNVQIDGSFRTRLRFPATIEVAATRCAVSTPHRGTLDPVAPRYWLPPYIARRFGDRTLVIADAGELARAWRRCAGDSYSDGPDEAA